MLQNCSLVIHPQLANYRRLRIALQRFWPNISKWVHIGYQYNSPHLVNPSLTLSQMLWRIFLSGMSLKGTFPVSNLKERHCKALHTNWFCLSLFSSSSNASGALHQVVPTSGMVVPRVMQLKFWLAKVSNFNLHRWQSIHHGPPGHLQDHWLPSNHSASHHSHAGNS